MATLYDIMIDATREVTQDDVERMATGIQAFGMLVTFLRNSQRIRDGQAAAIAVAAAKGLLTITDGKKQLQALLDEAD
jgi:hypothetical protein